jgi:hypothetical protein
LPDGLKSQNPGASTPSLILHGDWPLFKIGLAKKQRKNV